MGRAQWLSVAAGCVAAVTCAVAATLVARRAAARCRWNRAVEVVRGFEEECATPTERLQRVVNSLAVEMFAGLASEGASKVRMLLTCVDELPDGSEEGIYYAIDLGGTCFRVMKLELGSVSMVINKKVEHHPISEDLTKGTSEVGKDVSQCLNEALIRNGLDLQVTALVNNAVGTLAMGHYYDEDTVAAVIIGAGTNASYIECSAAITKSRGLLADSDLTVVNVEWGSFRPPQIPLTPYDICFNVEKKHNHYDQSKKHLCQRVYDPTGRPVPRAAALQVAEWTPLYLLPFGSEGIDARTPHTTLAALQLQAEQRSPSPVAILMLHGEPAIIILCHSLSYGTPCLAAIREDDSPDLTMVGRVLEEHLKIQDVPLNTRKLVVRICDIVT
nr:unnamed protein product [Digitaria exilis]